MKERAGERERLKEIVRSLWGKAKEKTQLTDGMITRVRVETMAKSFVSIMYLRTAVRDAITTMTKTIDTNHWRKIENMKLNISWSEGKKSATTTATATPHPAI